MFVSTLISSLIAVAHMRLTSSRQRHQFSTVNVNFFLVGSARLTADTAAMAKKPDPPKPTTWTIYKLAARQERLGIVEAPDEAAAMEKGAAEFGVKTKRLVAIRR